VFAFVMAVIKKTLAGAEEDEVADFKQALARRKESNAQEVSRRQAPRLSRIDYRGFRELS
jgi:hypothetical protein